MDAEPGAPHHAVGEPEVVQGLGVAGDERDDAPRIRHGRPCPPRLEAVWTRHSRFLTTTILRMGPVRKSVPEDTPLDPDGAPMGLPPVTDVPLATADAKTK